MSTTELEEFLQIRFNKKIKILNPKKDKKKDIVQIALSNCDELFTELIQVKIKQIFMKI